MCASTFFDFPRLCFPPDRFEFVPAPRLFPEFRKRNGLRSRKAVVSRVKKPGISHLLNFIQSYAKNRHLLQSLKTWQQ